MFRRVVAVLFVISVLAFGNGSVRANNNHNDTNVIDVNRNIDINRNVDINRNINNNINQNQIRNDINNQDYNRNTNIIRGNTNDVNQNVTIKNPEIPTYYPGFATNPSIFLPMMKHPDFSKAWNLSTSMWSIKTEWYMGEIQPINCLPGSVQINGRQFGPAIGGNRSIKIYQSRQEAFDDASEKVRYLWVGSSHIEKEGGDILDCEMAALAKAREIGANGIIVIDRGYTIASRTKGKNFGIGASGSWLERFGSFAIGLPVNFAYATALGDGYAKPYISFYIVEVR